MAPTNPKDYGSEGEGGGRKGGTKEEVEKEREEERRGRGGGKERFHFHQVTHSSYTLNQVTSTGVPWQWMAEQLYSKLADAPAEDLSTHHRQAGTPAPSLPYQSTFVFPPRRAYTGSFLSLPSRSHSARSTALMAWLQEEMLHCVTPHNHVFTSVGYSLVVHVAMKVVGTHKLYLGLTYLPSGCTLHPVKFQATIV